MLNKITPKLGNGMTIQIKETFRLSLKGMPLGHSIVIKTLNIENKESILKVAR